MWTHPTREDCAGMDGNATANTHFLLAFSLNLPSFHLQNLCILFVRSSSSLCPLRGQNFSINFSNMQTFLLSAWQQVSSELCSCVFVQARFEYTSEKVGVVHSSWSFVVESLSLSVPFLCVGVTREPQLYFSKRRIDFGELPVGASAYSPFKYKPSVTRAIAQLAYVQTSTSHL